MADTTDTGVPDIEDTIDDPARRRGPDLLTLTAGLGALAVAIGVPLGGATWLAGLDARWVLAALAMIVGLLLVISSVRPRRG
ncbi:MAG: hypothetical protein ACRDTC_06680 [Pseudonocardiaceae bacterium]